MRSLSGDSFERVYYKVIDFDTNEVVYEKEYGKKISNYLGIKTSAILRSLSTTRGFYQKRKDGRKYKFILLGDENQTKN